MIPVGKNVKGYFAGGRRRSSGSHKKDLDKICYTLLPPLNIHIPQNILSGGERGMDGGLEMNVKAK